MLFRRKPEYLKQHSRKDSIKSKTNIKTLKHGLFGFVALEPSKISTKQMFSLRQDLRRVSGRQVKILNKCTFFRSVTKKSNGIRLGRGKGPVKSWNSVMTPGKLIIELQGTNPKIIKNFSSLLKSKLNTKSILRSKISRWVL